MGEMKHTPGPWIARNDASFTRAPGINQGEGRLASSIVVAGTTNPLIRVGSRDNDLAEVMANAHLIAAAPDLRLVAQEALDTITDYLAYEHDGDPYREDARLMGEMDINSFATDGRLERLRAALSKAEGRSLSSASGQEGDHG